MAYKGTVDNIANAFSTAFRQSRDQAQKEKEFKQRMAEEQRQQGLLEFWRQKNFQADQDWRNFQKEDYKIDNTRQDKLVNAQIDNYKADNERQAERDRLTEEYRKADLAIKSRGKDAPKSFKGFSNYFKDRAKYLGTTATIADPDNEGMFIDSPLTQNEIKTNQNYLQSLALAELPQRAQMFYANTYMGKKAHPYEFYQSVEDAYNKGYLDDVDRDALLQFNDIRSDWGEFPENVPEIPEGTQVKQKVTKDSKGLLGNIKGKATQGSNSRINRLVDKYENAPKWTNNSPIAKGLYAGWDYLGIIDAISNIIDDVEDKPNKKLSGYIERKEGL
jgi:hypothetical protein